MIAWLAAHPALVALVVLAVGAVVFVVLMDLLIAAKDRRLHREIDAARRQLNPDRRPMDVDDARERARADVRRQMNGRR